jgi:hypothetical protein
VSVLRASERRVLVTAPSGGRLPGTSLRLRIIPALASFVSTTFPQQQPSSCAALQNQEGALRFSRLTVPALLALLGAAVCLTGRALGIQRVLGVPMAGPKVCPHFPEGTERSCPPRERF